MHLLLAAFFLLGFAVPLQAQTTMLSGTVVDETGAVVPGATVIAAGRDGREVATTSPAGEYAFTLAPGSYDITATLPGFAPAVRSDVKVGTTPVQAAPLVLRLATLGETVVITASRSAGTVVNAPATVSVLSAEQIAAAPGRQYGDLLRSVPGVNVVQLSARDVNVTAREATGTLTNSQLTLVDGRSVYLDFFGMVLWDLVPTVTEDIRQIEVVRGPASAVWGANALTGVVNIVTKSPREAPGATVTLSAGTIGRDAGSSAGRGPGALFSGSATVADAPNDRWSYRVSAGYFGSDAFPRPVGRIPLIADPRAPVGTVGGGFYPADTGAGVFAFRNRGTAQPKFEARVDQELGNGGRMSYSGGVAGTAGLIHTGIGPFDIQSGSVLGYGQAQYTKGALRINAFANLLNGEAPNLLLVDPRTNRPLQLDFDTGTYDIEVGHSRTAGRRHLFTYGGNLRRNTFDITIAPAGRDRTELGAYVQDEIFLPRVRIVAGGRVDRFGNIGDPVFSPRIAVVFNPQPSHAIRGSVNRAFRSPSFINNYLDVSIVSPVDLSGLAPLLPDPLRPLVATPFPLVVRAVGSELPIGGQPQRKLREEALTAYELAYTATLRQRTTFTAAFYVNERDDNINLTQLPSIADPYTAAEPPPGWQLPPAILAVMAQRGTFLPRTAFTYLNLGPVRTKGLELGVDHRFAMSLSAFANYSWQDEPEIRSAPEPFPTSELALPPSHRVNVGGQYDGARVFGSASINYVGEAFWSDVLDSPFHGFTGDYTMVNAAAGLKWREGRVTTSIRTTNLLNQRIQQHVFGDIFLRQVIAELKLRLR